MFKLPFELSCYLIFLFKHFKGHTSMMSEDHMTSSHFKQTNKLFNCIKILKIKVILGGKKIKNI